MSKDGIYSDTKIITLIWFCATAIFLGLAIIFWTQMGNRDIGDTNQAYQKLNLCILSYPPDTRSKTQIESCYDKVFDDTGVNLVKYEQLDDYK